MWGLWDTTNKEFARHYELWYDENAVAKLSALDEDVWIAGGPEVEAIEDAAQGKPGLRLYAYTTELEAEAELQSWDEYSKCHYCVMELPADEPKWIML